MPEPNPIINNKKYPLIFEPLVISKPFRALWIGNSLSVFGSSISGVIVPILVYSLSHSTVAMGLIMTAYMLPNVLILPFAGIFVDRINRAKLMRSADIIRCLLAFLVMLLGLAGQLTIQVLTVIMALLGFMDGLFQPAFSALRATVFAPEIRNSANALNQLSVQSTRLFGPAIGGLIVGFLSAPIGFGIDGLTYLISFICLLFLTNEGRIIKTVKSPGKVSFIRECFGGIQVIMKNTWLWVTIVAFSFLNICTAGVIVILVPWLINVHDAFPAYVYGLIMSGEAIGAALAAFIFGMRKTWRFRGFIAYGGICVVGLSLFFMPLIHQVSLIIALMTVEGMGMMAFGLVWETSLQELVAPEAFGRVASLDMLGSFALLPAGYLFTGWFAKAVGGSFAMMIMGAVVVVSTLLILCIPGIRKFD
ncbi:MFS transporter [Sporolactobacillus shoreae]|uniref:MFS transporter n=1 Tax=Sporolactobacillus shoreae TaxID=1465501 RepID=A0A4Z0GQ48_9BACL|nr:MFS transporter [Sporolactobacillus shoreae]TGA98181.1 MFS transporter [Sporolactobacillus shoreae]